MHFAGNAGALFFAHGVAVGGEFAQLLQGFRERLGALLHPLLQLGVGASQGLFGVAAGGDIHKSDHRALHHATINNRVG